MIAGTSSHATRTDALRRFRDEKEVAALLLPVRACAAGLTLTTADHVLLIDLQGHEAMELQLINRVHRIGQDKPVKVLRYIAEGTIEERMLHLRGTGRASSAPPRAPTPRTKATRSPSGRRWTWTTTRPPPAEGEGGAGGGRGARHAEATSRYLYGL